MNSLRELQICENEMLKDTIRICRRHHLRYYLSSGTLLGAVRHQGFIPWDDDVDIQMPYEDYQRFLKVAQDELGDGYFVQNSETDPAYAFAYTHIRKNNTTFIRDWDKAIFSHHGVWLDVFPMLYIKSDLDYRIKTRLLQVLFFLRMDDNLFDFDKKWLCSNSGGLMVSLIELARKIPRKQRERFREKVLKRWFGQKDGKYYCYLWTKISEKVPKEAFIGETRSFAFEGLIYDAPPDTDLYLKATYGDYMTPPPENERNGGHGDHIVVDLEHDWKTYMNPDAIRPKNVT